MKTRTLFLVILLFAKITHSFGQTEWTTLEYNPDVPEIEHNPMKGWMPGYRGINSDFPYSIDHFYIRLSHVYKDWDDFDWTAFEDELDRITGGGRHVVCRFWIYYPNQTTGLPDFLSSEVPLYSDGSPDWNDETLMLAMEEFIAEFGERYDGDDRIAMIEAGLYGKWGEWHTYPETERQMTQANKDRLLIAYKNAFDTTHIGLRQSHHASTYELKMSVGYYDDSFAYHTLCTGSWCSWNGNIVPDGITHNYKYHPFAGELRPEIQSTIFNAWPNDTSDGKEDLETCIRTTRLSFMKAFFLYRDIPTPTQWENALKAHKMMGYEFYVNEVQFSSDAESNVHVDVKIQNTGIAPFYYNWDVEFAAINSSGRYMGTIGKADWNMNTIYPDSAAYLKSFTTQIYGNDTYTILMRFMNPLEEITENARDLRFANSMQDNDRDGWLTLGTVTVEADNVDVTDVVIGNCPSDSITIGTTHLLTSTVIPYNATNQNVIWSSSDTTVATVDIYGEITPMAKGSTTITLYNHDLTLSDQCIVNIKEPEITEDKLISVNAPQKVLPGETVTVSVEYSASQELDIRSFIQLNSPPWSNYGGKTITVSRGVGTLLIEFQINESIPPADGAYKIVTNLLPVGAGWPDRIDEITIAPISVVMPVDGVSIDNCLAGDLPKGDSHQLSVIVSPTNASDQSVTWSSSDTSVATVSDNGLVTGIDDGTASIIVTTNDGAFTDTCEITVETINVTGVSLMNCPAADLVIGTTHQLTAEVSPANAYDQSIVWSSSDDAIATIDDNGLITAVSEGSVTITVTTTDGAFTDICEITVVTIPVTDVTISECPASDLEVGATHQLSYTVLPEDAINKIITWSSSDDAIASVDENGLITAVSDGLATITITTDDGGLTDVCEVNVIPVQVTGVILSDCPTENVNVGDTIQLTAIISPENAANQTVNWTSSDASIAEVDSEGRLTAISVGSALITVTTEDGSYSDACTVLVDDATNVSPDIEVDFNEIRIFPNPTSGILSLEFSERDVNRRVLIYNSIGQKLFNDKMEDLHETIDISHLVSHGIIYVQIQSAQNVATYKVFVLEK